MNISEWLEGVGRPTVVKNVYQTSSPVLHDPTVPITIPELINGEQDASRKISGHNRGPLLHRQKALQYELENGQQNRDASPYGQLVPLATPPASTVKQQGSECFERRKRHKTRPDLYEPFSNARKRRTRHAKATKSKPANHRHQTSLTWPKPLNKGYEMLSNFNAENVPPDRLTLKGSRSVGLFCNGRVSSPKRGRGLPDLTFSEMRFLQHPSNPTQNQFQSKSVGAFSNEHEQRTIRSELGSEVLSNNALCNESERKTGHVSFVSENFRHLLEQQTSSQEPRKPNARNFPEGNDSRSGSLMTWSASETGSAEWTSFLRSHNAIDVGHLRPMDPEGPVHRVESGVANCSSSKSDDAGLTCSNYMAARSASKDQRHGRAYDLQLIAPAAEDRNVSSQSHSSPLRKALLNCDMAVEQAFTQRNVSQPQEARAPCSASIVERHSKLRPNRTNGVFPALYSTCSGNDEICNYCHDPMHVHRGRSSDGFVHCDSVSTPQLDQIKEPLPRPTVFKSIVEREINPGTRSSRALALTKVPQMGANDEDIETHDASEEDRYIGESCFGGRHWGPRGNHVEICKHYDEDGVMEEDAITHAVDDGLLADDVSHGSDECLEIRAAIEYRDKWQTNSWGHDSVPLDFWRPNKLY